MRILRVTIEGFKVYRARIELGPMSPQHNVVVGANGSGKSNFFAAISFVLGEGLTGATLREAERKALLHEGVGTNVSSAYVEIVFDNSDGRLPVDRGEVAIKRAITQKKDDYFLDGKHVSKTEIASLFESAGLSRNNPTHIVPQGRVAALTTMRDATRLEMFREVAGTSTYDARRLESLGLLQQSSLGKTQVVEKIVHIESRLQTLDAEKADLARYRDLERQLRVAEYVCTAKAAQTARSEVRRLEGERERLLLCASERQQRQHAAIAAVEQAGAALRGASEAASAAKLRVQTAMASQQRLASSVARHELERQQAREDERVRRETADAARAELAALEERIAEVRSGLDEQQPRRAAAEHAAAAARSAREACERELGSLYAKQAEGQRFRSKAERDKHLEGEIKQLRASIAKAAEQACYHLSTTFSTTLFRFPSDSLRIPFGCPSDALRMPFGCPSDSPRMPFGCPSNALRIRLPSRRAPSRRRSDLP